MRFAGREKNWVLACDRGFTLVELIVTMTILTVVLVIAGYSFTGFTQRNRVNATSDDLVRALSLARSEAITRGAAVTACRSANPDVADNPSSPAPACTTAGSGWQTGYIVFADTNGNGARDADEELLRTFAVDSSITVSADSAQVADYVTYLASGFLQSGNNGTLTVANSQGSRTLKVEISATGRVRTYTP